MKLSCLCFTPGGQSLAGRVLPSLTGWETALSLGFGKQKVDFRLWAEENFAQKDALLFIGAAGIAVRAIAPLAQDKTKDPAVLVIDEAGHFVIPLLSGHIGGANRLAKQLAAITGGQAAITTATDVRGLPALDEWAAQNKLHIRDSKQIKQAAAKLLQGKNLLFYSTMPITSPLPQGLLPAKTPDEADVVLSPFANTPTNTLQLVPPCLALGIGCRKNTKEEAIAAALTAALKQAKVLPQAVCGIYSIDLKAEEAGLLAFCKRYGWQLNTYPAEVLQTVDGSESPSPFVKHITGTDNVCERSALAEGGRLLLPKTAFDGVTIAIALREIPYHFEETP